MCFFLKAQGHKNLIAIDYYGHGQTDIPTHPVSLYHVGDDIKQLMDQLEIKKAVIGGWSRGGGVSTAFYDAYPEFITHIIFENTGHNIHYEQPKRFVQDLSNFLKRVKSSP
ncbi:alpha/beta fold hydrolase [Pedobacter gandavensis]|uniref:alpha/beta fold hydrolase n=1 Tax=Pedobacter gandavensis TaxID=2679963 RepID=UPI002479B208|nr:alpha/beta hydrolase [Pedobacter gandavensis]WGQ12605.1 alpha/beta fold hydrolase [Pedobacter gandavensis]